MAAAVCVVLACVALGLARPAGAAGLPEVASYGERIVVKRDIAFPASDGVERKLDLYRPRSADRVPVVICWHGGNFVGGSKADMARTCALLADRGIAALAAK